MSLCNRDCRFFLCLHFDTHSMSVATFRYFFLVLNQAQGRKDPLYLQLDRKIPKPLQWQYKVIFMGTINNFTPCWAAERCCFWSSPIPDACFDFLCKKSASVASHSGSASSRRQTPSVPACCCQMYCTCLLKLNVSTWKEKPYSTTLFFLEKIRLTSIAYHEMPLCMKLKIYSNVILETEMPWGARCSDRNWGQA